MPLILIYHREIMKHSGPLLLVPVGIALICHEECKSMCYSQLILVPLGKVCENGPSYLEDLVCRIPPSG